MAKLKLSSLAVATALVIAPNMGSAAVIGFLGNFDVINDTGSTAYGFEIELEGLHLSDITDTFGGLGGLSRGFPSGRGFDPAISVVRYGAPTVTEYTNGAIFGTKVTYQGIFTGAWDYGTPDVSTLPSGTFATPGDNCWSGGGVGYSASTPCDHFGVGTLKNATKTTYSWLHDTGAGTLTNINGVVSLPAPAWVVSPNPVVGNPPVVVALIQAPAPPAPVPEIEPQFGEAIWVKVFTTELENNAGLEQLVGDNAIIENAVTETEWQLLQTDPGNPLAGQLESGYGAPVGPNAASIIRRYEFYKYAGEYDPVDHQAILITSDSHPEAGEIGTYIGAQNVANNIAIAAVPEPETYAMLLVGVGLIGLRLRSRKQARAID